jgi:hypothetical protein
VVPFGLGEFESEFGDKFYSYVLSFTDRDIDPNIENFYTFLKHIEDLFKKLVKANLKSGVWGCTYIFEELAFKSGFKNKDPDQNSLFRLNIKPSTELYDETNSLRSFNEVVELITAYCQIISLIELTSIWISSTEWGITWKVHQIGIYPSTRPLGGVSLLGESIEIHNVRIIENSELPPEAPPLAPPLAPLFDIVKPKIPIGGVSMLPFLSSITSGGFNLKKVDPTEKVRQTGGQGFEVSLSEILAMRNRLKKSN